MERLADVATLCLDEGITHTTTDDEVVYLVEQVLDDTELRAYLRTTDDGGEGVLGVLEHVVDGCYLFLHEVAQHLAVGVEVVSDNGGRSMLAVSCTKGVVNIYISVRSELLGELLLANLHFLLGLVKLRCTLLYAYRLAFLLGIETEVLEQQCLAGLEGSSSLAGVTAVGSKLNLNTESGAYVLYNLTQ